MKNIKLSINVFVFKKSFICFLKISDLKITSLSSVSLNMSMIKKIIAKGA